MTDSQTSNAAKTTVIGHVMLSNGEKTELPAGAEILSITNIGDSWASIVYRHNHPAS